MKNLFYILLFLFFFLIACTPILPSSTALPTPLSPTPLSIELTFTPPLLLPTKTANTKPTSLPDRPLSKSGPWVFVPLDNKFFVINPDGTGYSPLKHGTSGFDSDSSGKILTAAAQGNMVAYVEGSRYEDPESMVLKLRTFPGDEEVLIPLAKSLKISAFTSTINEADHIAKLAYDQYLDTAFAIGRLAWSPSGKYLAFTGAIDGPTSDVYVYSVATGAIKRLTDATTQAIYLNWTPDSRYIVHAAATSLNIGRSGGGFDLNAFWAAAPDGSEVRKLLDLSSDAETFGWIGSSKLVFGHFFTGMTPYAYQVQIVDVNTGQVTTWFDDYFEAGAYDSKDQTFLLSVNSQDTVGIGQKYPDGLYLLTLNQPPKKISDMVLNRWYSSWHPEIERFLVSDIDGNAYSVTANGEIEKVPFLNSTDVTLSPDGKYWSTIQTNSQSNPNGSEHNFTFKIGDWSGHIWGAETWSDFSADAVQGWSLDSHYCYLMTRKNFVVVSAPDFKILNTIPIQYNNFNWQAPLWIVP
jgi:Tol biopolymer transport system component